MLEDDENCEKLSQIISSKHQPHENRQVVLFSCNKLKVVTCKNDKH